MKDQPKHSPTPWMLCKMSRFLIIDASGCSVASAGTRSRNYDMDELEAEQKANAHLIAAAPELLEVLKLSLIEHKEVREFLNVRILEGESVYTWLGETESMIERIKTAIAKAERRCA